MEVLVLAALGQMREEIIDNQFSPAVILNSIRSAKIILKQLHEIDDSPLTLRALNGVRNLTYLDDDELVEMAYELS
jgi:hypothetical protein